jgi:hypothetical protein
MTAQWRMTRRWAFATIGLAAGFSGVAVILSIVSGVTLWIAEAALILVPLTGTILVARRAPPPVVLEIWRIARAGLLIGAAATLVYDATRTGLSVLDPSPYNPFEAIRQLGLGMLPAGASPAMVLAAGCAVHLVNGGSFGVIYAVFAGRRADTLRAALVSGIAWGLTLELIQSILYPGWLHITTVLQEFLVISGLGHLMYGVTLGLGVRRLLHQGPPRETVPSTRRRPGD